MLRTNTALIHDVLSEMFHVKQVEVEIRKLVLVVPRETIYKIRATSL